FLLATQKLEPEAGLDHSTLDRWQNYLKRTDLEHPYLKGWFEAAKSGDAATMRKAAAEFQTALLAINAEKKTIDEKNKITLGLNPNRGDLSSASLLSLVRDKYILWRDLFEGKGVLQHSGQIQEYLQGEWFEHLKTLRAE